MKDHRKPPPTPAEVVRSSSPATSSSTPLYNTLALGGYEPRALTPQKVLQLQRTIGNRATMRLLQPALSPRPIAPIQRVGIEEYEQLLLDDVTQNDAGQRETAREAVLSTVKSTFGEEAYQLASKEMPPITAHYPLNFSGLKSDVKRKKDTKGKNEEEKALSAIELIKNKVLQALKEVTPLQKTLLLFQIDNADPLLSQYGFTQLSEGVKAYGSLQQFSLQPQLSSSLSTSLENMNTIPQKPPPPFAEFMRGFTLGNVPSLSGIQSLPTSDAGNYKEDKEKDANLLEVVKTSAENTRAKKPPMDPNSYIHRHFTPATMDFLLTHTKVPIYVLEGSVNDLLAFTKQGGFQQLNRMADNPSTDFVKYMAREETGNTCLLILAASGDSYRREVVAHFSHYQDKKKRQFALERIHLMRLGPNTAQDEFAGVIKTEQLNQVRVLALGKVDNLRQELALRYKIYPVRRIRSSFPPLFGWLYTINNMEVLSLKIEPGLYAGRAGEFLEALKKSGAPVQNIVFVGTSGAIDKNLQKGDLVAPSLFAQVDGLEPSFTSNPQQITNQASSLPSFKQSPTATTPTTSPLTEMESASDNTESLNLSMESSTSPIDSASNSNMNPSLSLEKEKSDISVEAKHEERKPTFISGERLVHGAVDSILLEDAIWLETHRHQGLTVVEQEVGGLIKVLAQEKQQTDLFIMLTVSDVVGETSFDESDSDQTEQAIASPGPLMVEGISKTTGPIQKRTPNVTFGLVQHKFGSNVFKDHLAKLKQDRASLEKTILETTTYIQNELQPAIDESEKPKEQKTTSETPTTSAPKKKLVNPEFAKKKKSELETENKETQLKIDTLTPFIERLEFLVELRRKLLAEFQPLFAQISALHPFQGQGAELHFDDAFAQDETLTPILIETLTDVEAPKPVESSKKSNAKQKQSQPTKSVGASSSNMNSMESTTTAPSEVRMDLPVPKSLIELQAAEKKIRAGILQQIVKRLQDYGSLVQALAISKFPK